MTNSEKQTTKETAASPMVSFKSFIAKCMWKVGNFCHHPEKKTDFCDQDKQDCPRKSEWNNKE